MNKKNLVIGSALVVATLILCSVCCLGGTAGFFTAKLIHVDGDMKAVEATSRLRLLTDACQAYRFRNGENPPSLDALLGEDRNGIVYVPEKGLLLDPWGRLFRYRADGRENTRGRADIWAVDPRDGKRIGNWQNRVE